MGDAEKSEHDAGVLIARYTPNLSHAIIADRIRCDQKTGICDHAEDM
jgi:hypothetical protein